MANLGDVRVKIIPLNIGDKERHIKFDLNSFAELEDKYGSIQSAMEELQKGSIKAVRIILWAGLIHEEVILDEKTQEPIGYKISPYQVGSWIGLGDVQDLSAKLQEAMESNLPKPTEETTTNAAVVTGPNA